VDSCKWKSTFSISLLGHIYNRESGLAESSSRQLPWQSVDLIMR